MATQNKNFKVKNGLDVAGAISGTALAGSLLSSTTPSANGTASAGVATIPARADHVHPASASGGGGLETVFLMMGA